MIYKPTDAMPEQYNLLTMLDAGLSPLLAVDLLMHDRSIPFRGKVERYDEDALPKVLIRALIDLNWIKDNSPHYKVGQRFKYVGDGLYNGEVYLLSRVTTSTVSLISLKSGNRWCEPVKVENINNISYDEFRQITAGYFFQKQEEDQNAAV